MRLRPPRRPSTDTALLLPATKTHIAKLDGVGINAGDTRRYELLLGQHEVLLIGLDERGFRISSAWATSVCFVAEPKHVYEGRVVSRRRETDDLHWEYSVVDLTVERDVSLDCRAGPAPISATKDPATDARSPAAQDQTSSHGSTAYHRHAPGNGFLLGFDSAWGGEKLASAGHDSLSMGDGFYAFVGATLTPVWLADRLGLGLGGSIGWKYGYISASNGDVSQSESLPY